MKNKTKIFYPFPVLIIENREHTIIAQLDGATESKLLTLSSGSEIYIIRFIPVGTIESKWQSSDIYMCQADDLHEFLTNV